MPTKQQINYKSESAALSSDISLVCNDYYPIQRSNCNIFPLSTDSKQHQEWCRNPSKLQIFSVPKLGKKKIPWRILLTWRLFHHLYYASAGGRGKKGRDGPKPIQILLQNLLKEMSPTTSAWTHTSTEYQAFLGFLEPWQNCGATDVSHRSRDET